MGLLGLALLLGVLAVLSADLRSRMQQDAADEVEGTTYLLADHAKRLFEVADVALQTANVESAGLSWEEIAGSEVLYRRLRALRSALPYIEDVWLNDTTGELRATSFAFPHPQSNAADRDAFKAQLKPTDRMFVGERIVGRVTKRPTFLLARRLENPDNSFRGMVSVTADLAYFNDYWTSIRLPYDARVTLLRADTFDVLAQHPAPAPGAEFVPAVAEVFRDAISASPNEGRLVFTSARGDRRVAAYRRVGALPLYVSVTVAEGAVDAAWRQRLSNYALFAILGSLAFLALAVFGFRQAQRDALANAALLHAQTELSGANTTLEATVAERTSALRASEGRLRLILESSTDYAIVATDLSGTITQWNVGARNVLGWEASEAIGQNLRLIFTEEDRAKGVPETELGTAMAKGRASDERWHRRKDGSRFFAIGTLVPMRDEAGVPTGFVKIMRDRTKEFEAEEAVRNHAGELERQVGQRTAELQSANERLVAEAVQRQQAEEQLRQSQKMEAVGRLTGGIAHDFNNLLTVVTGNLDMLRRRLSGKGEDRVERLINNAVEGANRAAALTYRLHAFSRQHPLAPEPVDANKLVAGMSDLLRRTLGENIAVETVLAGGLWRTHADPNQLESALLNLAVNARDAMPDGGKLTIETQNAHLDEAYAASRPEVKPGQYVMVAIADTGFGMSAEVIAKAFEPFFTTKPVGKGTGLGLSQVFGFAKQSNGHAAIYSELGHGTTIKLYLPRFKQAGDLVTANGVVEVAPPELTPRARSGETVLVVEDEPLVRDFSVGALEDAGYRVLAAEDGPAGLALLDANPDVALLFTDVVLTGPLNGRKVADEAISRRPGLKALFTTGYTRNAIIHHGRLDDGVQMIGKPFTADELARKVRQVLDGA